MMASDYAGCSNCGDPQWSCDCWEMEAGKYVAGRASAQERLEQLRDEAYGVGRGTGGRS